MVYIQERLVQVRKVQIVLGFVVLGKRLVFWGRKLAERRQVCVHISDVEAVRLVEVTIPGKRTVQVIIKQELVLFLHKHSKT